MDSSEIDSVIDVAWRNIVEDILPEARRIDLDAEIRRATRASLRVSRLHLAPWLRLLDEALRVDLALHDMLDPTQHQPRPAFHIAFVDLVARATALTLAIRHLVTRGLEDAARPVARSLIETQTLALVALTDEQFAQDYYGDNKEVSEEEFWYKSIARGKLEARLDCILEQHEFSKEDREELLEPTRQATRMLSGAVHSSASSTACSAAVPSLAHPGMLCVDPLGDVSAHTPGLISLVATHTRVFAGATFQIAKQIPELDAALTSCDSASRESFFAALLVLQEVEQWCSEHLSADFDDLWTAYADLGESRGGEGAE